MANAYIIYIIDKYWQQQAARFLLVKPLHWGWWEGRLLWR
jgi:hypothetical protein